MSDYGIPEVDITADGGLALNRMWWCRLKTRGGSVALCYGRTPEDAVHFAADRLMDDGFGDIGRDGRETIAHAIKLGLLGRIHGQ